MQTTVDFKCDGSFEYEIDIAYNGNSSITKVQGSQVSLETHFGISSLYWDGLNTEGERSGDNIDLDVNHQLVPGTTCWSNANNDGSCANNHYIDSISGDGC